MISDWETRLSQYIEAHRTAQFEWGRCDCCTFSMGAIEAVTGVDHMSEFRGHYSSELGSLRALKRIGAGNLEKTLDTKFSPIPIGRAKRGDLAFFAGCVGVVMGDFAWFMAEDGLEKVPRRMWDKAWAVNNG